MKNLLTIFLLSFSVNIFALVSFPFTGKVTQHFNDSSTIEIEGQPFLVNEQTVIHSDSETTKRITVGTSVGYELDESSKSNPLPTIKSLWLLDSNE